MGIIILMLIGIIFLGLTALTFLMPRLMIKLVESIGKSWAVDKELFMQSALARMVAGGFFLSAAAALFYAAFILTT